MSFSLSLLKKIKAKKKKHIGNFSCRKVLKPLSSRYVCFIPQIPPIILTHSGAPWAYKSNLGTENISFLSLSVQVFVLNSWP